MYSKGDEWRQADISLKDGEESQPYRSPFRRDYARVLHSPYFRRLGGKTQLFPGHESDFFRNRLTHSLEVAQIAKDIAIKLNSTLKPQYHINLDLCEIAGLVHDLGHPPFGHNGEDALDYCMREEGGFEGNAQTLRILLKLDKRERTYDVKTKKHIIYEEERDCRIGLNLTARAVASAMKYDNKIPLVREKPEKQKGYYHSEKDIITKIKKSVLAGRDAGSIPFKTVECQIMDIADDIAYCTYDIEDAFKAGFLSPIKFLTLPDRVINVIKEKTGDKYSIGDIKKLILAIFGGITDFAYEEQEKLKKDDPEYREKTKDNLLFSYKSSAYQAGSGYERTGFTSALVSLLMRKVSINTNEKCPPMSIVTLGEDQLATVAVLKHLTYELSINSVKMKITEFRGYDIVTKLFGELTAPGKKGYKLLPEDYRELYDALPSERNRTVCDFIAGMTDRYALEFYCRLFSENPQSIFKPI